ncbi:MAG TPA: phosphonate ABC transporter, permease protein PhnE [Bacilli bacterium]|nr:phosphonate ABC transporter, permease protein PhnE [Bacilli bacterium]
MAKMYTLSNGKVVTEPGNKSIIYLVIVLAITSFFMLFIPIDWKAINFRNAGFILGQLFTPTSGQTYRDYFAFIVSTPVLNALLETIRLSFGGTLIGALASVPLAVLSARNIVKKPWIYQTARAIMNFIRTIPMFVIAVVAIFFLGYGILPGIAAIAIFTFGIMTKMVYETIETIDMGPVEALDACGANKVKAVGYAVFPQVLPIYLGYFIYCFEINVRSSVILGFIGAGGIGIILYNNVGYRYDRVGGVILLLFVVVVFIQSITRYVRGKLQ